MSYADRLMSAGERIVLRDRQHWFVLVWSARYALLALIGALLLFIIGQNLSPEVRTGTFGQLLGLLAAVALIGGLAYLAWQALRYRNQEYVLTNRRVMQAEGVINKRVTDSSLEKINDAVLTQSLVGRIFGFGDLDVLTASESGIERFRMILDPIAFKRAMLEAKHEYEIDMNRAPTPVGPPLRAPAEVTPSAAPASRPSPPAARERVSDATDHVVVPQAPERRPMPAAGAADREPSEWTGSDGWPAEPPSGGTGTGGVSPVGQAAARPTSPSIRDRREESPAPRMSPDEVTRTLASLADLRDRGAISPEEYDGKKQELLGRL
jgi:hypothetical protein